VTRASLLVGTAGILVGSFLVAIPGVAGAVGATWFVNPAGDDSNSCASAGAPCRTIAHAQALASDLDTISLAPGTYTGALIITKAVNIVGAGQGTTFIDAAETTPSASSASAMLVELGATDTNPLTVSGVTIERGISKFGGGIELVTGTMVVNNSTITNNQAGGIASSTGGGGIGVLGTVIGTTQNLTLNGDTISHNKTVAFSGLTLNGGGLYLAGPTAINSSTISANSTAGSAFGGGAYVAKVVAADTPILTATDTTFSGNSSVAGGGIAVASGGQVSLTGDGVSPSAVSSNTGTDGAGVYDAATASFTNTTLASNVASFEGGGLYDTGAATFTGSTLTGNTATTAGGGLVAIQGVATDTPMVTMQTTTIGGSVAAVGGGAYVTNASTLTMTGGGISSSSALDGGGAYVAGGGTANLSGVTFGSDLASAGSTANAGLGGGIFDAGSLSITGHSVLSGNRAAPSTASSVATGWGGAVFEGPAAAGNAPTFTLTNSSISGGTLAAGTDNAAVGGGIAVAGNILGTVAPGFTATAGHFTGSGDTFSGNTAVDGGGAYVGGNAAFSTSSFSTNSAAGSTLALGGAILVGKVAAGDVPLATINATSFTQNVGVLGGAIAVNSSSTVNLGSGSTLSQNQATNSGGGLYEGGTATIADTTFTADAAAEFGGGIFDGSIAAADTPSVTESNVTMTGNTAAVEGGGVAVAASATLTQTGGSIDNGTSPIAGGLLVAGGGKASVSGADISGNTATDDGGGVFNLGSLTLANTTLTGNQAVPTSANPTTTGFGGAIYSGTTAASSTVLLTLTGDTLSGNTANAGSALITASSGSGDTTNASVTNTTITGNTAGPSFGAVVAFDPLSITSSTINANAAPTAAGGSGGLFLGTTAVSLSGSVVAGNSGGNCSSAVMDGGYNLTDAGAATCGFSSAKHDLTAPPQLGALGANGGPTPTELPAASSPLINVIPVTTATGVTDAVTAAPVVLCATGATDQRGVSRPQGAACDIGSVEAGVQAPGLSGPASATFIVGAAGGPVTFTATGIPTPALSESGALPSGVTLTDNGNGTATLAGTPAAGTVGSYPITIGAANGTPPNATLSFTLTVDQAAALTGPASDTFTVNSPGSDTFTATGTPTPALSESGALPSGVTFTDHSDGTATLAGTPAAGTVGTYHLVITAHNGEGADATLPFTLTVVPAVSILTTTLPGGTVGVPYSATLAAANGKSPYLWSTVAGALPAGLVLTANGVISGRPTGPAGTANFTVEVTDSATPAGTATQALSLTIAKGTTTLVVNPVLLSTSGLLIKVTVGTVSATLTGGNPALPIAGQTVTFMAGTTVVCSGVTSASGAVTCTMSIGNTLLVIANLGVTAQYAGSDSWLPSSGSAGLL
jgi:hypothetical protein